MADNQNMNQPLTGGGGGDGDSVSQTSQSSRSRMSGSLLERIQAQRSREQQNGGSSSGFGGQPGGGSHMSAPTPSQITIPTYGPGPGQHPSSLSSPQRQQSAGEMNDFGILSDGNGWGGGSSLMMSSGMEGNTSNGVSSEALLGGNPQHHDSQYSMGEYFKTFVMDVYNLFRALPIWVQVPLLALLLFLVIKLI